jgi:hypothetical protein
MWMHFRFIARFGEGVGRCLPDHLPVWANVADVPGGGSAVRQAVVGAGFRWEPYGDGTSSVIAELDIDCEFPTVRPVSP